MPNGLSGTVHAMNQWKSNLPNAVLRWCFNHLR